MSTVPSSKNSWKDPLEVSGNKLPILNAPNVITNEVNKDNFITDSISDIAIFTIDLNGIIFNWNLGAERLFGKSRKLALQKQVSYFLKNPVKSTNDNLINVSILEFHKEISIYKYKHKLLQCTSYPLYDEKRILKGSTLVVTDVSKPAILSNGEDIQSNNLQSLFNQAPALIAILRTREGIVELFNPMLKKLWGKRNVLGKTMRQAWPELNGKGYYEMVEQVYDSAEAVIGKEYPITIKNKKSQSYFNFIFQPYLDAFNNVDGVMVLGIEVTEQVNARLKAELNEARLLLITESLPQLVWTADANGSCDYLNNHWYEFTGLKPVDSLGYGWAKAIHPEDRLKAKDEWKKSIKDHSNYSCEYRLRKYDGNYEWHFSQGKILQDYDNNAKKWFGTTTNINKSKQAEKLLQKHQEILELAQRAGNVGTFEWLVQTNNVQWTTQLESLYGLKPNTFGGTYQDWLNLIHPEDRKHMNEILKAALENESPYNTEFRILWPSGQVRWMMAKGDLYYDRLGVPFRMIGVNVDITDRKNLEQQKDEFIGIASHELKTPLTSMKVYSQILERKFIKSGQFEAADSMARINSQLNNLTGLVGDLLDVTKIESGKLKLNITKFDFNKIIIETIETMKLTSESHEILLKIAEIGTIESDPERISQVLINLISNAIKYSPHGKKIIVKVINDPENIFISVKDYGIGISKEKQNKIFERFFRVNGPVMDSFPGLGLGLYISAEIVKRLGGKIGVKSELLKGSVFTFSIPLK